MRALRVLLRHRVTSWLRDPGWGTGTVAGQIVLLGLLLVLLFPVGLGSYAIGAGIREVNPDASVLRLLNGGMLYLVPALTLARFFLQSPPSGRLGAYLALPIRRRGVLRGQILFALLSVHTVFAVVVVGPVWGAEVWPALSGGEATAWLASALLLAGVLPALGMQLLNVLLGREPAWFLGALLVATGVVGLDAVVEVSLLWSASKVVFGTPLLRLIFSLLATAGTYAVLLRVLEARVEVDRRTAPRPARSSTRAWGAQVYRWIESTLPAGRLVALELRGVVRTRRLRGLALMGITIALTFFALTVAEVFVGTSAKIGANGVLNVAFWGLGGALIGVSVQAYAISAGHIEGTFARPHRLEAVVASKIVLFWTGLVPGTLLLLALLPWLSLRVGTFLGACALYWWGVMVPAMVYLSAQLRTPVDLSASAFSFNGTVGNLAGFALLPVILVILGGSVGASLADAWWTAAAVLGGLGLLGLGGLSWSLHPLVRQLDRHRHAMVEGFRENEPI